MKDAWRRQAVVVVASALAVAACSTTQPDRITGRTMSLSVVAFAKVTDLDCFERWQDTDLNGTPDLDLDQEQCFELGGTPNQKVIPWFYSLAVTIIRSGTTTEDIVVSKAGVLGTTLANSDLADDFISMTDYDPGSVAIPDRPPDGDIFYLNGEQVSQGSSIYIGAASSTCGSCPLSLGPTNILGGSPSFDFDVNSGDTIIVRGRKQKFAQAFGYIPEVPDPQIQIIATLSLGGVPVSVNGTTTSPSDDGTGFAFSFTVR